MAIGTQRHVLEQQGRSLQPFSGCQRSLRLHKKSMHYHCLTETRATNTQPQACTLDIEVVGQIAFIQQLLRVCVELNQRKIHPEPEVAANACLYDVDYSSVTVKGRVHQKENLLQLASSDSFRTRSDCPEAVLLSDSFQCLCI
jgi:hypothetical protein